MDTYSYDDYIYTVIGFAGAFIGAIATVPNIVRVTRRFKSKDISYAYQIMLGTGVLLLDIYYIYYKSVLAIPTFLSVTLIYYLAGLKFYIEMVHNPREAMAGGCTGEDDEHKLLLEDDERSDNAKKSAIGYGTMRHDTLKNVTQSFIISSALSS